jgi:predicted nucleic acid-binding protein
VHREHLEINVLVFALLKPYALRYPTASALQKAEVIILFHNVCFLEYIFVVTTVCYAFRKYLSYVLTMSSIVSLFLRQKQRTVV